MAVLGGVVVADDEVGNLVGQVVFVDAAELGDFVGEVGLKKFGGSS